MARDLVYELGMMEPVGAIEVQEKDRLVHYDERHFGTAGVGIAGNDWWWQPTTSCGSLGLYQVLPRLHRPFKKKAKPQCVYCGTRARKRKQVKCLQCGAPYD